MFKKRNRTTQESNYRGLDCVPYWKNVTQEWSCTRSNLASHSWLTVRALKKLTPIGSIRVIKERRNDKIIFCVPPDNHDMRPKDVVSMDPGSHYKFRQRLIAKSELFNDCNVIEAMNPTLPKHVGIAELFKQSVYMQTKSIPRKVY
eukprot:Pgem_evm1s377